MDRVIELDRDDDLYCQRLEQPWYHGNEVNQYVRAENVLAQFARIFGGELASGRATRPTWSLFSWRAPRSVSGRAAA